MRECPKLFRAHFRELGRKVKGIPLDIDWNAYAQASALGRLHFLTVRADDDLIGYVATHVGPHNNYRSTTHGFVSAAWLHPDYRSGWTGYTMLKENDRLLKKAGVARVTCAEYLAHKGKHGKRLRVIFQRLGYVPIEVHYEKVL